MRVSLDIVTMLGSRYLLIERDGAGHFPQAELQPGEAPGDAARRVLREWTGATEPKLEVVDFIAAPDELRIVMRALLAEPPKQPHRTAGRMELPAHVGRLSATAVEEALKTSLAYKLTRPGAVK